MRKYVKTEQPRAKKRVKRSKMNDHSNSPKPRQKIQSFQQFLTTNTTRIMGYQKLFGPQTPHKNLGLLREGRKMSYAYNNSQRKSLLGLKELWATRKFQLQL